MPTLLLTNDDGVESPTLLPLARAMQRLGDVRVVVPEHERSWIGKAISRFGSVRVRTIEKEGFRLHAIDGTPADCVVLGMYELFDDPPDMVVSGINLGLNYGTAFILSSGTVGAAIEACLAGVPAFAFSLAIPADAYGLSGAERGARLGGRTIDSALTAADITRVVWEAGFPSGVDVLNVNLPADSTLDTPREVTRATPARYGPLFAASGEEYKHRLRSYRPLEVLADGDMATVERGHVSITPLRIQLDAPLPDSLRAALEAPRSVRS
jgi:5'/3'-nucleotidase